MTHAELLRSHANLAIKEGGMYYSGEYLSGVATVAESLEAENAKLRELAVLNWEWAHSCCGNNCKMQTDDCGYRIDRECNYEREIYDRMRELGIEVEE